MSTDALLAILSTCPTLTRADLQHASPPLRAALLALAGRANGHDGALLQSLSHLTKQMEVASDRIAASEESSAVLRASNRKVAEQLEAEKALCGVYEGRWREERQLREELEGVIDGRGRPTPVEQPIRIPSDGSSILDIPSVRATAARSSSARTATLEAEVRALELEVERRIGIRRPPSVLIQPSPIVDTKKAAESVTKVLTGTIAELNSEIEQLRKQLQDVTNERTKLLEVANEIPDRSMHPTDLESLAEVTAERDEYSRLLVGCHSEIQDLSTRLAASQSQIEALSERVRIKLEEQKSKIVACHARIAELSTALEEAEHALETGRASGDVVV